MSQRVPDEWRRPKEETKYNREHDIDDDLLGDRDWYDTLGGHAVGGALQPATAIEALLQCAPGDEPLISLEESLALREAVACAIERLPERERWVFDALVVEGKSLRTVAAEIGYSKSQIANIRNQAVTLLRGMLTTNLVVRRYLNGDS